MTDERVLIEFVPLLRRLLAGSERPDVARVGSLGEIAYLVEQRVEQAELDIYDVLIADCSKDYRAVGAARMQELRDALEPYVGKALLRAGMQYASHQYTIYINPDRESIVHLVGFGQPSPEDPPQDASPSDQARWIFDHPSDGWRNDGRRVVDVLLDGRDVSQLTCDELRLLAKGYNWCGLNAKAFKTAKLGLVHEPHSTEWLSLAQLYVRNACLHDDLPRFLTECDTCIVKGVGPAAFWHLLKADRYIDIATGESELEDYEWMPGDPIRHPELLRPAAEALASALACDPRIPEREIARGCGDWNVRYAALLQAPEFAHLRQEPRGSNG